MRTKKKFGLIRQVFILVTIGMLIIGYLTYFTQFRLSDTNEKRQTEQIAAEVGDDVIDAVKEFPAYDWLLRYWYYHADELDIEYDVDYRTGKKTAEKYRLLTERHPGFSVPYASYYDIQQLPEEDQKLYAEITYSWLITRINEIKRNHDIDFLFCVLTEIEPSENAYQTQFFLFSAADPDSVRGTEYLQVYPIGVFVSVAENESQQQEMRAAVERHSQSATEAERNGGGHLADAGNYVDYYEYLTMMDGQAVLIGMTYDLTDLQNSIRFDTMRGTGMAMIYQIILLMILLIDLYLFAIHPLEEVAKNINLYRKTKDSARVNKNLKENLSGVSAFAVARNEIGQLTEDVINMTEEIDDYIERIGTITAEKERIGVELDLASRIQADMMPRTFPAFPDRTEFDLFASMTPAREVGGDFYDYYMIDDDHLAIVIADVSGKGVPAALFMMASKILLKTRAMIDDGPAKVLAETNEEICSNNREEMFVTVWMGILEVSTGVLTAANAGHEYPVVKEADGDFTLLKDKHGFVIGGMPGMQYQEYQITLKPGDKVFVYTDGVPEATDSSLELFGTDRMVEALRTGQDGTPKEVLGAVNAAVEAFTGDAEQFDDMTMLCVEYKGKVL